MQIWHGVDWMLSTEMTCLVYGLYQ